MKASGMVVVVVTVRISRTFGVCGWYGVEGRSEVGCSVNEVGSSEPGSTSGVGLRRTVASVSSKSVSGGCGASDGTSAMDSRWLDPGLLEVLEARSMVEWKVPDVGEYSICVSSSSVLVAKS